MILDLRYFKQRPDLSGDLLGKAQRDWFESQLSDQSFDALMIGSSVQCLPMFTAKDSWFQYPESRSWLINQIDTLNKPTLIISGDRHFAEFSQAKLPNGRMLTEFTSSGLTHTSSMENENSFRIGEVIRKRNFGIVDLKLEDGDVTFNLQVKDATSGKTLKSLTTW